jgi:hypothetical protein
MTLDEMDEPARQFLKHLFDQTEGQTSRQISMYAIGAELGWDREAASQTAQGLMASGLVDIRTLSGGIGLSSEGAAMVQAAFDSAKGSPAVPRLADSPVMDRAACEAVEGLCDAIKAQASRQGLDFDALAELMADLKTIAHQLGSPRPKTAIVRECLRSLEGVLKRFAQNRSLAKLRALIGDS